MIISAPATSAPILNDHRSYSPLQSYITYCYIIGGKTRSALRELFLSISAPLRTYLGYMITYFAPVSAPNSGEYERMKKVTYHDF